MLLLSVLLAAISFVSAAPTEERSIPVKISDFNERFYVTLMNKTYYFGISSAPVEEVTVLCEDLGMKLLSIETFDEDRAIIDYLKENGMEKRYWTSGLLLEDAAFDWMSTGEPFTHTNWFFKEPDFFSPGNSCVLLDYRGWFDNPCDYYYYYICE